MQKGVNSFCIFSVFEYTIHIIIKKKGEQNMLKTQISPSQNSLGGGRLNSPKILVLPHFKGYLSAQNIGVKEGYLSQTFTPKTTTPTNINTTSNKRKNVNYQANYTNKFKTLYKNTEINTKYLDATPCAFLHFQRGCN